VPERTLGRNTLPCGVARRLAAPPAPAKQTFDR